jgi:arsenate reductase-like glutaredoxin family protein
MTIRVFGSHDCERCSSTCSLLDDHKIAYVFIDADRFDDAEINELCDNNNVSDLPHIQFLDDQKKVVDQLVADFATSDMIDRLERFGFLHDRSA